MELLYANLSRALLLSILVLLLYVLGTWIYNLCFHPLRKYPGPKLAAMSLLYFWYYQVVKQGQTVRQLEKLHKIYGSVVRCTPNELHFSDPRAYTQIYAPGSKFLKEPTFYSQGFRLELSSFGSVDPVFAKKRREVLAPLFSRRAILKLETLVQEKISKFIRNLNNYAQTGITFDLSLVFRSLSMDVITEYAFAQCANTLDDSALAKAIVNGIDASAKVGWQRAWFPEWFNQMLWHIPAKYLPPHLGALAGLLMKLEAQVDAILADPEILQRDVQHEILYHHLLATGEKGQDPPSRTSLIHEAQVMLTAGSDTVGTACMGGTYYLLKDHAVREQLVKELTEAWPDVSIPISYTQLEKLPYLTAVIKESLRMAPGVLPSLRRVVPTDVEIAGYHVPRGTTVGMGVTFVHFNEEVFPEPFRFKPGRWLDPMNRDLDTYLVPFSKGPRSCIGVNLAWSELYLIFANVFRKVDIVLSHKASSKLEFLDFFLAIPSENTNVDAFVTGLRT